MNKKINKKFRLFKKCDDCEKVRHINLFYKDSYYKATTCNICEQKRFNEAMSAMDDYYYVEAERQAKNEKEVFDELEKSLCKDFLLDIKNCIKDCDGGYDLKIVNKPRGSFQKENYDFIKHIYVDQSCGYCEDDYYGEVYIPLPDNKYLQFSYQC